MKKESAKAKPLPKLPRVATSKFKKTEATRLCRAVLSSGLGVDRVTHDPKTGVVTVYPKYSQPTAE
jgi:hypothetical protein